jgi:hypothetical protein
MSEERKCMDMTQPVDAAPFIKDIPVLQPPSFTSKAGGAIARVIASLVEELQKRNQTLTAANTELTAQLGEALADNKHLEILGHELASCVRDYSRAAAMLDCGEVPDIDTKTAQLLYKAAWADLCKRHPDPSALARYKALEKAIKWMCDECLDRGKYVGKEGCPNRKCPIAICMQEVSHDPTD